MTALLYRHQAILTVVVGVAALTLLWDTPVLLPLKILVVFFHELAHLLMTLFTGGAPESLSLTPHQGGSVLSRGGNRFLILSAGYLGSLLIGLALFMAALKGQIDRWVMTGLGLTLILVALLYVRDGFAFAFCIVTGAVMLGLARFTGHAVNDAVLRLIGLTSMIYVPLDIFSDTLARSELRSDARMLAEEFGGPTMFWGGLWLVLSVVVLMLALRMTVRHTED